MKKEMEFKVLEGKLVVTLELKEVNSISAIDIKEGTYHLIKMQGLLFSNEGKLLHSGNLSNNLPMNDKIAIQLRQLWKHNNDYVYGTLEQLACIGNISTEELLRNRKSFNQAISILKEEDLLVDRGISFGGKALVMPLPQHILDIATDLLVA